MRGRPAKPAREVDSSVSGGFHTEESPMTSGKADTVLTYSLVTVTSSDCAHEVSVPQIEAMGRLANSSMEVACPFSDGFRAGEPSMTLGKAKTESYRASMGLFLSNFFLSLLRAGIADLGVQDGDEGGWVDFASVSQGIDTLHQGNQLVVSADCGYTKVRVSTKGEAVSADLGLGNVDSP